MQILGFKSCFFYFPNLLPNKLEVTAGNLRFIEKPFYDNTLSLGSLRRSFSSGEDVLLLYRNYLN